MFALINRPDIFDLTPGNSFVEYLLEQGYDVFLLDWGVPDEAEGDLGLEYYACDALPWGIRETLRACGEDEVTLLGWCIGGTLCAMHAALEPDAPVRNLALLTTPDRHRRVAVRQVDRARLVRPRAGGRHLPLHPGRGDRLRQQDR